MPTKSILTREFPLQDPELIARVGVTEQEFYELFPGHVAKKVWMLLTTHPRNKDELLYRYLPSKLWRMNNLYKIIDKDGNPLTFKMRRAQLIVYSRKYLHHRIIILKSRQQGISTLWLIAFEDDAIFLPNLNCGLMAQGREEAQTLLERVKYTWEEIPEGIKDFANISLKKDNASEFSFSNKSTIFIRTSFRSATLHRLHISELGKIANASPKKAKETKTGTLQTLAPPNLGVVESTAEGNNMFKTMWDNSEKQLEIGRLAGKDFYPVFLSWLDDPDCVEYEDQIPEPEHVDYFTQLETRLNRVITKPQRNFWIAQERELEGDIHQEYPATAAEAFSASKDGTYFSRKYLEHIIRRNQKKAGLYDPNLEVYCVMDLGRNDYYVMLFFQFFQESNGRYTIRIIDEYFNSGEGLDHYAEQLLKWKEERDWDMSSPVGLPHDGNVVDLSTKGNRSREDILHENGITNTTILDKQDKSTSIEDVRKEMPNIWIDEKCYYIEDCFLNYTKEWNDLLMIWRNEPRRDKYAHGGDTIQYMVQYVLTNLVGRKKRRKNNNAGNTAH